MVALKLADPNIDLGSQRLQDAYDRMGGDTPNAIPFLIWLFENPNSPLALPGAINLQNHDCLHLLLNKGFSLPDEAFVVGFTMGNDPSLSQWHIVLFKVISSSFYPKKYQFSTPDLTCFNLGLRYGRQVAKILPCLNKVDLLKQFGSLKIKTIRQMLELTII